VKAGCFFRRPLNPIRGSKFSGRFDFGLYPDTGALKEDNFEPNERLQGPNQRRRHCETDNQEDRMVMLRLRSYCDCYLVIYPIVVIGLGFLHPSQTFNGDLSPILINYGHKQCGLRVRLN
jgi:hypothetical protein